MSLIQTNKEIRIMRYKAIIKHRELGFLSHSYDLMFKDLAEFITVSERSADRKGFDLVMVVEERYGSTDEVVYKNPKHIKELPITKR